MDVKLVMEWFR